MKKVIIFDQYSRYKACSEILTKIGEKTGTILDVGSGEECILENFLPNFQITYVDPLLATHPERTSNKIAGNVSISELDNKKFDYVFCIDTFEHIPKNDRKQFLERISNLTKKGIVMAGPCSDAGDAIQTDKWVNETYYNVFGKDYPWLHEHFEHDLPKLTSTLDEFHELGFHTTVVQNAHTPWLRKLLPFVVCALEFESGKKHVDEVSEYFNQNLYKFDHLEPCYRQVIFASIKKKDPLSLPKIDSKSKKEIKQHWENLEQQIITKFSLITLGERKLFKQAQNQLKKAVQDVGALQQINLDRDSEIKSLDSEIKSLEKLGSEKDAEIQSLEKLGAEKDTEMQSLEKLGAEKDTEMQSLEKAIENYQKMITDIHQSFVFRMLHKYDRTIGKILPLRPKKYAKSTKTQSSKEEQSAQKAVVKKINLQKKDIICFPIINWDYRTQRPQHLMSKFSESGHRVFYFTVNLRKLSRPYEIKELENNIFQVELNSPKFFDIYKDKFNKETIHHLIESFRKLQEELDLDAILFIQFPTWSPFAQELKKQFGYKMVFDCLDDFRGFGNVIKERDNEEKILLKKSDLVLATSSHLLKKVMSVTTKNLFLPNAGEYDHFHNPPSTDLLKDYKKPIIGYFGAIADWFDTELIEYLASKRPDLTFLFIGHTFGSDIRKLQKLENVHFLGERPYSELPKYLHDFNVCLIPFKNIPLIHATHPVKIYEYLAAGKPVVTTNLDELKPMADLCYIAKNKDDFLEKLDIALKENDSEHLQKRIEFASKNTWQDRFEALYSKLDKIPSFNLKHHN